MTTGPRDWMRNHPRLVDVLIATAVLVLSLLAVPATPEAAGLNLGHATPLVVAALVVGCAALLFRRTHPAAAWVVALVATVSPLPVGSVGRGLPAAVAALYAVAAYGTRRQAVVAALVTMVAALVLVTRANVVIANDPVSYAVVAWCGLAAALGDAVRSNREVLAAALDRARRAEQTRDQEAQRRVAEERLRISRELHDVVAHHIAVVNVQAGVAEHLASTDPARAAEALQQVRAASSEALAEMGGLVGLLRTDGEGGAGDLEPAPGAGDLPRLVEALRSSGADVRWRHEGPTLQVATAADLHLYRIIQEALTNAARHGRGPIALHTRQDATEVVVEVTNRLPELPASARGSDMPGLQAPTRDGNGSDAPLGGHGLVGMRERVALAGGRLDAGPTQDGWFRVHLTLPVAVAPAERR